MCSSTVLLITILAVNTPANANWSIGTSYMPKSNYMMAVAATNESIFLIGGYNSQSVLEFNQTFVDKQVTAASTYGTAQFYTQINDDELLMINSAGTHFNVYNTRQNTFNYNSVWNSMIISFVDWEACLTSTNQYLFILGGVNINRETLNTVHIYDMNTNEWRNSSMNTPRQALSCNYVELTDQLYAIGGMNGGAFLTSVETITITDILNGETSWNTTQISNLITQNNVGLRSVVYQYSYIVVVGGTNPVVDVNIINVIDGTVTLSGHNMIHWVIWSSVVIFNDILYVFGGWNDTHALKTCQFIQVSSMGIDTAAPTKFPTTAVPTTAVPTTAGPTTAVPTKFPTTHVPTTVQPTTDVPTSITPNDVSTQYNKLNDTADDDGTLVIIIVVFGSLVIVCVLLLGIMMVHRLRKQQKENEENITLDISSKNSSVMLSKVNSVSTVNDTDAYENKINDKIEMENIPGNDKNNNNVSIAIVNEITQDTKNESEQYEIIKKWLTETVQLPQYHENFVVNGYTSMSFIKAIKSKKDLSDIGIKLKGHQVIIIDEINRLNGINMKHTIQNSESFQHEGDVTREGGATGDVYENEVVNNPNIGDNDIVIDNANNTTI